MGRRRGRVDMVGCSAGRGGVSTWLCQVGVVCFGFFGGVLDSGEPVSSGGCGASEPVEGFFAWGIGVWALGPSGSRAEPLPFLFGSLLRRWRRFPGLSGMVCGTLTAWMAGSSPAMTWFWGRRVMAGRGGGERPTPGPSLSGRGEVVGVSSWFCRPGRSWRSRASWRGVVRRLSRWGVRPCGGGLP